MQDIVLINENDVIISFGEKTNYEDSRDNFELDSGIKLDVKTVDYNRTTKSCWIDGKAFQKFPNDEFESILNNVKMYIQAKEKREQIAEEQEEAERLANMTEEEKAAEELKQAKAERADAVSKILVTVDGMTFDGDEESQQRVARSIIALEDGETMPWVLYDNTIVEVTKEQLKQVLRLAGQKQSELWVLPYTTA